jgi:hypothetical protein
MVQVDTQQSQRIRMVASETTKKKRKPKPSFFEQIRKKWSLKLGSTREISMGGTRTTRKAREAGRKGRGEPVIIWGLCI